MPDLIWSAGLLVCWSAGLLVCWSAGLLVCWSAGLDLAKPKGKWRPKEKVDSITMVYWFRPVMRNDS